eukprot:GCRY01002328.1.p1 GENE.GCRY01002328.1~~GCRY01002328.1.p1  ORF type:complete len:316 (-),score=62.51 GCRY01002328.1:94-1041(-)
MENMIDMKMHDGNTAIHLACASGHPSALATLISIGADPALKNNAGETPLHLAAMNGSEKSVQILLQEPHALNAIDEKEKFGQTALHYATKRNHLSIMKTLIELYCDLMERDENGYSALHFAQSKEAVDLLLSHCCQLSNLLDNVGRTAWELFRVRGDAALMAAYLTEHSCTAIVHSSSRDTVKSSESLPNTSFLFDFLENKDQSAPSDKWGNTPLHHACEGGLDNIVQFLLEKGESGNALNNSQESPLYKACKGGHVAVVKRLLAAGCSVGANGGEPKGRSPLQIARERGHTAVVRVLLAHTANHVDVETPSLLL